MLAYEVDLLECDLPRSTYLPTYLEGSSFYVPAHAKKSAHLPELLEVQFSSIRQWYNFNLSDGVIYIFFIDTIIYFY